MKTLVLLLAFALLGNASPNVPASSAESDVVYICTEKTAKRYHAKATCLGLRKCNNHIKAVSIAKARQQGRTPCKICY